MSFVDKIKLNNTDSIAFYSATASDGLNYFAYIRCSNDGLQKMKIDCTLKKPVADISKYGNVLYLEFNKEPSATAKAFLDNYIKSNS